MSWEVKIFHTSEPDFTLWKSYYDRLNQKGVYHSPEYIKVLEGHYQNDAELFVFGNEDNFIYYPYFKRSLDGLPFSERCDIDLTQYYDLVSSWYYGGPVVCLCDPEDKPDGSLLMEFLESFRQYCQRSQIVSEFIRFDPNIKNYLYFQDNLPIKYNRETIYVDLTLSEEDIWAGYKGRCRTAIKKGQQYPVEVAVARPSDFLHEFYIIYDSEMTRKNAPSHYLFSKQFFKDLMNALQEKVVLFAVTYDKKMIGGTICLIDKSGIAYDYLTATLPDYWEYQVNNLLFHEVILWCRKSGVHTYDFHGGRDSVAFFKASFSSSRRNFYVSQIIHAPGVYDLLVSAMHRYCDEGSTTFFPEYRTKDTN